MIKTNISVVGSAPKKRTERGVATQKNSPKDRWVIIGKITVSIYWRLFMAERSHEELSGIIATSLKLSSTSPFMNGR